ncbi:50S ribosomal protein L1 [Clostridium sp. 'deep sea']|uniref:50S ribosomal protein L1 n=1 Tax=Clostridium sp. 'deep sea' TaxID=2779445 RepID=UPI0018966EB9|nr:50S ribosomal protein L1 [Clostridium sp. 'deep sea']QOR34567.1 50S ribosomal protein L1 [Clostridium sp. 'deep sea']
MAKQGKRYSAAKELVDRDRLYDPLEALELVKKNATAKFDETIELAVKLGVNPRHADQQVRGAVTMPAGLGRTVRMVVFAKDDAAEAAKAAGADMIGDEEVAKKIQGGWMDFDLVLATPDMMRVVGRLGRVLGPRGLMPNPKAGTVTADIANAVKEFKAGKIEYRVERAGIVHAPIGKASFSVEDLKSNFNALMGALMRARPAAAKGQYVKSVAVSSTMGPGIKINQQKASE